MGRWNTTEKRFKKIKLNSLNNSKLIELKKNLEINNQTNSARYMHLIQLMKAKGLLT